MNVILDLVLVVLYLVIIFVCAFRGFVKSIWSMVTIIGSILLTCIYGPIVGDWIHNKYVHDYVSDYVYESVEAIVAEKSGEYYISNVSEVLPEDLLTMLHYCGADIEEIQTRVSSYATVSKDELYSLADTIASPISDTISNIVGFVAVFVCSVIAISLMGLILKLIVKMPVIKSVNFTLGAVLGVVEGFIVLWIICMVIGSLIERGIISAESNETIFYMTESSHLLKFFGELSLLDLINVRIE